MSTIVSSMGHVQLQQSVQQLEQLQFGLTLVLIACHVQEQANPFAKIAVENINFTSMMIHQSKLAPLVKLSMAHLAANATLVFVPNARMASLQMTVNLVWMQLVISPIV